MASTQNLRLAACTLSFATGIAAQSINGLGVSGGDGPRGGIGDGAHPVQTAQSFITDALIPVPNSNTTRQLAQGPAPVLSTGNATANCSEQRIVVVDSCSGARQQMLGFGHSWTDSTVSTFNNLEPDILDQLMQELFGQGGNNMGFMRHTMGSSDLSGAQQYSFDDNGPSYNDGEPDLDLSHFTLGADGTAMAQMLARMGRYKGDVFLYGAPWSLPGWMKNNDLFIAGIENNYGQQYPLLNNSFNINLIPQAIDYYLKYIDTYLSDFGVSINGLSMQNEPLNYQGGYPTMYLEGADEAALLNQGLGQALLDRGVLAMAYDHNTDQPVYPYRVLQGAPDLIRSVAWHCYQGPAPNYTVIEDIYRAFPNAIQFMTECTSYLPTVNTDSFQVAQSFMLPVQHGASGASMWVLATDPDFGPHSPYGGCNGCQGSIIVNSSTTYTKMHDYYMVGQFSRFVRRGSVNYRVLQGIEGNGFTSDQFYILAIQNPDKSWAVIFMNNVGSDQEVALSFTGQSGQVWHGTIPSASVVTWLLPSQQILGLTNGTHPTTSLPPYPYGNSTVPASTGTFGTGNMTATPLGVCNVTVPTTTSSSSSTSVTALPVPDTTHSFPSISVTETASTA
ncbi:hypothetical protein LTR86_007254 [Recurvomyces mirabilis]|nr:hypothetical protein LTR86_007254 [Recurvomyces mirabilis]